MYKFNIILARLRRSRFPSLHVLHGRLDVGSAFPVTFSLNSFAIGEFVRRKPALLYIVLTNTDA